ncbi:MAG: gliding motility-associated C-terminal domain-containing protein [Bacteroidia bacterium]|nr:gliding motility-associated C-terminal domain-containing protein [Bacteroidia bacterium]
MLLLFIVCEVRSQIIDTVCAGDINVIYSVDQHAGSTYQWNINGGRIRSGNGQATILVDWFSQPGLYHLSVLEKNILNCAGDQVEAFVLIRGKNFKVNYPPQACINDTVIITGNGGDRYLWSNGDTNSSISIKLVRDTSMVIRISANVCGIQTDSFPIKIKAVKNPVASFSPDISVFYKDQHVLFNYMGSPLDNVSWELEKSTYNKIVARNINVTFIDTGQAYIKLVSVNNAGCRDSIIKMINIKDEHIFMPNAFTPNGDKLNDEFKAVGHGIKTFRMTVFNRWGEEIFKSYSILDGWNGFDKGDALPSDAYGYSIEAIGNSGKSYSFNGSVTLLK